MFASRRITTSITALLVSLSVGCGASTEIGRSSKNEAPQSSRPPRTETVNIEIKSGTADYIARSSAREISWNQLKFDLVHHVDYRRELLPSVVQDIMGSRVRTTGYMLPDLKSAEISAFILQGKRLMRFGHASDVCNLIIVEMRKGVSMTYSSDRITIEGTFDVEERRDGERILSVYKLMDAVPSEIR